MDITLIKQLLVNGEKVDFECKEAKSAMPKSAYESYSAFANTNGGLIVLGVSENKKAITPMDRFSITGVENPQKVIEDTKLNQVTLNLSMVDRVERKSTPSTPSTSSSLSYKDSDLREKIINLMQKNCRVTKKELSKFLGVSMYALKKQISILRAEGIVYFEGNSKNGRWIIQR